jgi:hypothetical protein
LNFKGQGVQFEVEISDMEFQTISNGDHETKENSILIVDDGR